MWKGANMTSGPSRRLFVLGGCLTVFLGAAAHANAALDAAQPATQPAADAAAPAGGDQPAFKQEELEQMLAPIALYPDSLLSQIFMASTYPLEVVEADRWVKSKKEV